MISIPSNWVSLRTKITGLAIIPALVCSIIFGLLIWATSHSTARLVGAELTRLMAERTSRACVHGWNTSVVTYGYVMETLEADIQTASLMLEKDGGAHLGGSKATWQATNEETQAASTVSVPGMRIGAWQATPDGGSGPLKDISAATGRATVLFERVNPEGDMMRVAGAAAQ